MYDSYDAGTAEVGDEANRASVPIQRMRMADVLPVPARRRAK